MSRRISAHGPIMASTPSTRRLLDGVAMSVHHRSTEPARPRHLVKKVHATHWLISTQVATFAEQARWHGRSELLGSVLDWGFPLMALPSLYAAARFEAVWKSISELGYPEKYCVDLREPPRHRADAVTGTASRRWRGAPEI